MKFNSILSGCAHYKNQEVAIFSFEPRGRPGTSLFGVLLAGGWQHCKMQPKWTAIGLACAKYSAAADWVIVATSSSGELWEMTPGGAREKESTIQGDYSDITRLAGIDNAIWACGMDRLVLMRRVNGTWDDLSAPSASVDEGIIGFTDLASLAPGEIIAVGWKGEIWLRRKGKWHAEDSGTNANFNAVSVGDDGGAVVVGDNGAIVIGRRNQWAPVDVGVDLNLQGVSHFGSEIFVCSDETLFRFEQDALVEETRFAAGDAPATCLNLIRGPISLFSQGESDLFRYSDGLWSRLI